MLPLLIYYLNSAYIPENQKIALKIAIQAPGLWPKRWAEG
jgi:hypothetical protein